MRTANNPLERSLAYRANRPDQSRWRGRQLGRIDGFADFVIGATGISSNSGAAHLYLGTATPSATAWNGTPATKRIDVTGPDGAGAYFGISVAGAGDVNGDGYPDFVVGAYLAIAGGGAAHLYLGGATPNITDWNGNAHTKRIDLAGPDSGGYFGISVASAGDVTGTATPTFSSTPMTPARSVSTTL